MTIREKIAKLRERMEEYGIDIYIVPTADYHQSEYVGEYFKCREFMTGFTGSAGTAVFTKKEAFLWTDGRYFIQAAKQLDGTGIVLQKSGEPNVPTVEEWLKAEIKKYSHAPVIGFDGRTISNAAGSRYLEIVKRSGGHLSFGKDLVGEIWENRPDLPSNPAFTLNLSYAGESVESKLSRLREKMHARGADFCVITGLDDIGWIFNIRGQDVAYCPLILSYAVIRLDGAELYADVRKFDEEIKGMFKENSVELYPYEAVGDRMKKFRSGETVMLDPDQMNYALYQSIPENVKKEECENPVILMKAIKNGTEIKNIRQAHLKDGIACTKFMYWLKTNVGKQSITELQASAKLENFRADQSHFIGPSFAPICAYKEHAAIVHYSSTTETDVELKPEGMFLCDTGGHYLEGSTDITRTIVLGTVTEKEKKHFTTVLCSMLNLADARFLYGCTGMSLDYAAREPFWRQNLNFNHGTGHGVGYLGNIHEPPARFFWKMPTGSHEIPVLEPGMVITDEPGIYIEGSHGIRTENELLITEDMRNEYGQFLKFENLTFVPIDLDAVEPELMTDRERELLNAYHAQVREKLYPYLDKEEQEWLIVYTRKI